MTTPKFYNAPVETFTLKENTYWRATDFICGVMLKVLTQWNDHQGWRAPASWLESHNADSWEKSLDRAINALAVLCSDAVVYDAGIVRAGMTALGDILPYLYITNVNKD